MKRNVYNLLAEKYSLIQENPLETEITSNGTHKSDHNVEMARTKAHQVVEIAPQLHELLEKMDTNAPLHAWMVTHVTQAADMLQDVLAKLKEDQEAGPDVEPVKDEDFEPNDAEGDGNGGYAIGTPDASGVGSPEGAR